ncbi:hypothetical protein BJX96DRAFT_11463 [Aspergillus floccosus]
MNYDIRKDSYSSPRVACTILSRKSTSTLSKHHQAHDDAADHGDARHVDSRARVGGLDAGGSWGGGAGLRARGRGGALGLLRGDMHRAAGDLGRGDRRAGHGSAGDRGRDHRDAGGLGRLGRSAGLSGSARLGSGSRGLLSGDGGLSRSRRLLGRSRRLLRGSGGLSRSRRLLGRSGRLNGSGRSRGLRRRSGRSSGLGLLADSADDGDSFVTALVGHGSMSSTGQSQSSHKRGRVTHGDWYSKEG